jgi:hypothetical protein
MDAQALIRTSDLVITQCFANLNTYLLGLPSKRYLQQHGNPIAELDTLGPWPGHDPGVHISCHATLRAASNLPWPRVFIYPNAP